MNFTTSILNVFLLFQGPKFIFLKFVKSIIKISLTIRYFFNLSGKGGGDKIHNKENTSKNEELSIKEKVKQLMELTCRSEDEVCLALHESDNDINMAINFLYEEISTVSLFLFYCFKF